MGRPVVFFRVNSKKATGMFESSAFPGITGAHAWSRTSTGNVPSSYRTSAKGQ
jgi:hypothetical protein